MTLTALSQLDDAALEEYFRENMGYEMFTRLMLMRPCIWIESERLIGADTLDLRRQFERRVRAAGKGSKRRSESTSETTTG